MKLSADAKRLGLFAVTNTWDMASASIGDFSCRCIIMGKNHSYTSGPSMEIYE